jgi:AraC-like DNA-binding protein
MPNATPEAAPGSRRVEIHLAAAQSPDAFEIWHTALAEMFDVALAGDKPAPFRGDVVGFHLGDCLTFNNASVGQRLVRTTALAKRSGLDHVMIQYQTSGHLRGEYDGRAVDLHTGDIGFLDFARATGSSENDFSRLTLIVPRERLPAAFHDRDLHGVVLHRDAATTRLLGRYMRALWRSAAALTSTQASAAVDAAFTLADGAWGAHGLDAEHEQAAAATLRQMAVSYIDEHLTDRGLTPIAVAAALRLSRTSLYRLFAHEGGVHAHILARRLDRCLVALVDNRARSQSIGSVAFAHGFNSEAHFSRAFRSRFGISARDLRGMVQQRPAMAPGPSDPAAVATLFDWVRSLGVESPLAR